VRAARPIRPRRSISDYFNLPCLETITNQAEPDPIEEARPSESSNVPVVVNVIPETSNEVPPVEQPSSHILDASAPPSTPAQSMEIPISAASSQSQPVESPVPSIYPQHMLASSSVSSFVIFPFSLVELFPI
jgi:hypothetical protein